MRIVILEKKPTTTQIHKQHPLGRVEGGGKGGGEKQYNTSPSKKYIPAGKHFTPTHKKKIPKKWIEDSYRLIISPSVTSRPRSLLCCRRPVHQPPCLVNNHKLLQPSGRRENQPPQNHSTPTSWWREGEDPDGVNVDGGGGWVALCVCVCVFVCVWMCV